MSSMLFASPSGDARRLAATAWAPKPVKCACSVDEPGDQGVALKVMQDGGAAFQPVGVGATPDEADPAAGDGNGLGVLRHCHPPSL